MIEPAVTLEQVYQILLGVRVIVNSMDERLRFLNGTVRQNCEDLAVLKDWRTTQANAAIHQVGDLKVELARMGAFGGGFSLVLTAGVAILKAAGVL